MHTVKIPNYIKFGTLTKIVDEFYEIPQNIICEEDGHIMNFNSHFQAYICTCSNCKNMISTKDYVERKLKEYSQSEYPKNLTNDNKEQTEEANKELNRNSNL